MDTNKILTKLYALETEIFLEEDISEGLVNRLRKSGNPDRCINGMSPKEAYLLGKTLNNLDLLPVERIQGKRFPLGFVDPVEVLRAKDCDQLFERLLLGYQGAKGVASSFVVADYIFNPDSTRDLTRLDEEVQTMAEIFGEEEPRGSKAMKTKLDFYIKLRLLVQDFSQIGELISFGRVKLLGDYMIALLNLKEDRRREALGKILRRTYPFSDSKREEWKNEISSF